LPTRRGGFLLLKGEKEKATRAATQYRDLFGERRFFLEVQDHGLDEDRVIREGMVAIARETLIPLVPPTMCITCTRSDAEAHEVLYAWARAPS
jgi:DNA polymerase-3 subunit alpha